MSKTRVYSEHADERSGRRAQTALSGRFVFVIVFLAGVGTLGIEMLMPRLLAPFFGNSQPIWAIVIGSTLVYLASGYWLGGWLADRTGSLQLLLRLIAWAGLCCGLIPLLAGPVLNASQQAFLSFDAGTFLAALVAVVLLFAAPVVLLATVGPFATRLVLQQPQQGLNAAGQTIGTISALSTLGSLLGTFVTVFGLIPWLGTERTLYLFAVALVLLAVAGLRDWRDLWMLLVIALLAAYTLSDVGLVRAAGCAGCTVLAEDESAYNYIQVVEQEVPLSDGITEKQRYLMLNEGHAIHSLYRPRYEQTGDPRDLLTGGGPWDFFAVAPYVYPERRPADVASFAMLGAAAGTVPKQMLAIYGDDLIIDAVEIDARILDAGQRYFAVEAEEPRYPNYHTHTQDARTWLAQSRRSYDIIGVDAYHQPYVPFHLTTVEFFEEVRAHLTEDGVVAVNAARPHSGDERLVEALAVTMQAVFPQVFMIDTLPTRGASNVLLIGVMQPVGAGAEHFHANAQQMEHPTLEVVMDWALHAGPEPIREFVPDQHDHADIQPFTDDHAPVEQLIDGMLLDEARQLTE